MSVPPPPTVGTDPPPGQSAMPGARRSPRAERSRAAIADAALALLREGQLRPTAGEIAERAGISERLVYHHFTDLETLFRSVVELQVAALTERAPSLDPSRPVDERVRAVVDARAEMNEWITPVRRASVIREPFSEILATNREALNAGAKAEVGEIFALELARLDPEQASDLLAGLDLALSWPAWDALRVRGASIEQARRVVERTVRALLAGSS